MTVAPGFLSVDVEDFFHVEAFADVVDRGAWESYPSRVEANTKRLLQLFDEQDVKATFFVLGWVADRQAALVREIVDLGHEVACHSYWHRLVYQLTPEEFRSDTRRAKESIEQAAGATVRGYRAPSFSITERSLWAFDVLGELGFEYTSSVFPIRHDVYGLPRAPRRPFRVHTPSRDVTEYPLTTFRIPGSGNLPVGGGAYLRILPRWYAKVGLRRAIKEGIRPIVYVHPWEIDPGQPRLSGRLTSRLRHYTNLAGTERRLRDLLAGGGYGPFRDEVAEAPMTDLKSITGGSS